MELRDNMPEFFKSRWRAGTAVVVLSGDETGFYKSQINAAANLIGESGDAPQVVFHDKLTGFSRSLPGLVPPRDKTNMLLKGLQCAFMTDQQLKAAKVEEPLCFDPAEPAIFVFSDFDFELKEEPRSRQLLRNAVQANMNGMDYIARVADASDENIGTRGKRMIVMLTTEVAMPKDVPELSPHVVPLPDIKSLLDIVTTNIRPLHAGKLIPNMPSDNNIHLLADACKGLTAQRCKEVVALAIQGCCVKGEEIDEDKVSKMRDLIEEERSTDFAAIPGVTYYSKDKLPAKPLPGYERLIDVLVESKKMDPDLARKHKIKPVGAVLVAGVPGVGKTQIALSCASKVVLDKPMLLVSMGEILAGIVGESQKNARRVIQIANATGAVVLLDDIDKSNLNVAKNGSSGDSGTWGQVVNMFLTEMAMDSDAMYILTLNRVANVPAEMTRKGRMDFQYVVVPPDEEIIKQGLLYHVERHDVKLSATDAAKLAKHLKGWVGAEFADLVQKAVRRAVANSTDKLDLQWMIDYAAQQTPLMQQEVFRQDIKQMLDDCKDFEVLGRSEASLAKKPGNKKQKSKASPTVGDIAADIDVSLN